MQSRSIPRICSIAFPPLYFNFTSTRLLAITVLPLSHLFQERGTPFRALSDSHRLSTSAKRINYILHAEIQFSRRDSAAKRANLPCHSAGGIRQADAERSALEEEIDQLALRGQLCGLTPTGDEIGIEERTGGGQQNLERTEISSACAGKEESVTSGTFRRSVR
jgi:hypothetical protein